MMRIGRKKGNDSRVTRAFVNSSVTLAGQVIQILAGFLVRRLFIQYLGENFLGYESVFSNILQMLNNADLGISLAITGFLYKPLSENDEGVVAALMYLYKRLYQIIGVLVLLLGVIISLFLPEIIPDAQCSIAELRLFFYISLAGTVSTYYMAYKRTLLMANQKTYMTMFIDTIAFLVMSVFQIIMLLFCPSYVLYLVLITIKNIISNLIISAKCSRLYTYLKRSIDKETYETYKPHVIRYVKDTFVARIGGFVFYSTDNLVLSICRGSILAGHLSNYSMITQQVDYVIRQIFSSIQSVFGNFISVTKDEEEQRKMTDNYFLICSFLGIFCMLCVMFLIQPFVQICFGKLYLLADSTVLWMSVNLMLSIMIQLPAQVFVVYKLYHYDRPIVMISAALNIIISVVLVKKLGINGVLIGTFITSFIYLFSRLYIISRYVYTISYWHYIKKCCEYFLCAAGSAFILGMSIKNIMANTLFMMIVKMLIIVILAIMLPICFLSVTDEFRAITNMLVPRKLRRFLSRYVIWICTMMVLLLAIALGHYSGQGNIGNGNKSLNRGVAFEKEVPETKMRIFHLSFDDVIDVFIDLTRNEENYESIFENATLNWMRELHEKYGVVVSCYVFYQDDGFSLADCPTKYRTEFEENADWLRFGFHALDSATTYGENENSDIVSDYKKTMHYLQNIVGGGITSTIRLHYYKATRNEVFALANDTEMPVTGLLCADDARQSYYLAGEDNDYIYCHDEYYDASTKINFISTDIRIEYVEDIDEKIMEFSTDAWNNQLEDLVVFTHEWALTDSVKKKIETMCRYAETQKYEFVYLEDVAYGKANAEGTN